MNDGPFSTFLTLDYLRLSLFSLKDEILYAKVAKTA
jgi:hypothetical protein